MTSAKLIKSLEKKGFFLEFPSYASEEEIITEILKENNARINLSLPLFLDFSFDYKKIISSLNSSQKKDFNQIILISDKIYKKESIKNNLCRTIKNNKIKEKFLDSEFNEFYSSFKESLFNQDRKEQKIIEKQSKLRLNLDLNKDIETLFSPAKIRIMKKIFNHETLTNTELKYYYRAISKINKAVLNPGLQDYLRIIEISKKEVMKS